MIKRGEVYWARLDDAEGHQQKGDKETGYRPVVTVSNNQQNVKEKIFVVVPLTSKIKELQEFVNSQIDYKKQVYKKKKDKVQELLAESKNNPVNKDRSEKEKSPKFPWG